jgi:hypothetical protein
MLHAFVVKICYLGMKCPEMVCSVNKLLLFWCNKLHVSIIR